MSPQDILDERKKTHGSFEDHARITQELKDVVVKEISLRFGRGQPAITLCQRESIAMILHKIGRILAGDAAHDDHWDDIAGYALLGKVPIRPPVDLNKLSERDLIPQTDRAWTDGHPEAIRALCNCGQYPGYAHFRGCPAGKEEPTVRARAQDDVAWEPLPEFKQQIRAANERENKNERY